MSRDRVSPPQGDTHAAAETPRPGALPGQRAGSPPGTADDERSRQSAGLSAKVAALEEAVAFDAQKQRWTSGTTPPDRALPSGQRRVTPRWRGRYMRLLLLLDLLASLAAVAGADRVAGGTAPLPVLLGLPVLVVLAVVSSGAYQDRVIGEGTSEFRRILVAGICLLAAVSTGAYAADAASTRPVVLGGLPLAVCGVLAGHVLARTGLRRMRARGRCRQRVVLVGLERSVAELARTLRGNPGSGMLPVAACVSAAPGGEIEGVPVLGTPNDAALVMHDSRADSVILTAWSDVSQEDLRRLAWDLEGSGAHLLVAPRIAEVATPRTHVRTVAGQLLIDIEEPEFRGLRRVAKRALDLVLTVGGLVALAPVMVALAVAVKVSSPGPVFFRQERIGRHGEPFRMTKFRSMYVDAEERLARLQDRNESEGPLFKMRDDPRVTRVGRVIRRYSLDELPQLFDVLRGSMSLVGPRPPLPREVSQYEDDVRRRLLVTPGVTGLWQVSGRSDLSWEESVRLDLSYVENWSLVLDLSIIARTVLVVAQGRGAY